MQQIYRIQWDGSVWQGQCLRCGADAFEDFIANAMTNAAEHNRSFHGDEATVVELYGAETRDATLAA